MTTLIASRLKHRITLQQQVRTADTYGGYSTGWQDIAELWGEIVPAAGVPFYGKEYVEGKRTVAKTRYRITIRYRRQLTTAMRLKVEEKILRILSLVEPIGQKRSLELLTEEVI